MNGPHGSTLNEVESGVWQWAARNGREIWTLKTVQERLETLTLHGPDTGAIEVRPLSDLHPVLGEVDGIYLADSSRCIAQCGRIDWARPDRIPPIDRPAALPPGTGTALINAIAVMARLHETGPLRYRGPYPTAALFDTLLASFDLTVDPPGALARFTADAEALAMQGRAVEIPVDFVPAPHEWAWPRHDVCVQLRRGLERAYVLGKPFERDRIGPRRLRPADAHIIALVELAGAPWHVAATFDDQGTLLGGPHDPPKVDSSLLGDALPTEIVEVLAQILASRAPAALREPIVKVLAEYPVVWADTGLEDARARNDTVEVHAILGERLPGLTPAAMLEALGQALEPVVARLCTRALCDEQ